jgi:DNA topoisomerase VI subunit B
MRFTRQAFEISRELEYFSAEELEMQIGHGRDWWPVAILKELVDNALDACEFAGTSPRVDITIEEDALTVQDNGPGLPDNIIQRSLDYTVRVSDKVHYVGPTRGRIGNALKTVWAAPFVVSGERGEFDVFTPGQHHQVTVELDRLRQVPMLSHEVEPSDEIDKGTRIVIRWPEIASYLNTPGHFNSYNPPLPARWLIEAYAACNPHAHFIIDGHEFTPTDVKWGKWGMGDRTSAHWYTAEALRDLIAAYITTPEYKKNPKTVRALVSEFRGLSSTRKQRAVTENLSGVYLADLVDGGDLCMAAVRGLLERMQGHSSPPRAQTLGKIGEDHLRRWMVAAGAVEDSVNYCVRYGDSPVADVVEAAFGIFEDRQQARRIATGLNWGAMLEPPVGNLRQFVAEQRVEPQDPVLLFMHVAHPALTFADRGKTRVATTETGLAERLSDVAKSVTRDWKDAKQRADRQGRVRQHDFDRMMKQQARAKVTIRDACFAVMKNAFDHASDGGRFYANARQIMYAARPMVLELTGGEWVKNSDTFTQTYLKDYLEEVRPAWAARVVWDARGHFAEPHGGERIGLGGIEVMNYHNTWTNGKCNPVPSVTLPVLVNTRGPNLRFSAVVFIEKEGFGPILEEAQIAERYDLAIASTKGMTVGAACDLFDRLGEDVRVFAVHDFDISGLNILNTLREGTRLTPGRDIIDFGFRLEDVDGLPSEEVSGKGNPVRRLQRYGATEAEIGFLVGRVGYGRWSGQRVELNAMTTGQFIDWLEGKLDAAGVKKVVPSGEVLRDAYRRACALREIQGVIEAMDHGETIDAPDAERLESRVREIITENPVLSWDRAVWIAAGEER